MRLISSKLCARLWPIEFLLLSISLLVLLPRPVGFSLVISSITFRTLVRLITVHEYGALGVEKVI